MHSLLTPGSASDTESVALPSYVMHSTIRYFRSSHQLAKNCIEIFTVRNCSLEWVARLLPHVSEAPVSAAAPLFFAQKNLPIVLDTPAR
jgi:hypothetical protein